MYRERTWKIILWLSIIVMMGSAVGFIFLNDFMKIILVFIFLASLVMIGVAAIKKDDAIEDKTALGGKK